VGDSRPDISQHLDALRRMQNADGGWGYFPGKQSWLEPTAYAALALHGEPAADRAWSLIKSWQSPDGSWRPSAEVQIQSWVTSLAVTVAHAQGDFGDPFHKGVAWLLEISGQESDWWSRVSAKVQGIDKDRNLKLTAWPWKPDTSSWVEPTSHALVALKQAASKINDPKFRERVKLGEAQLLDVRGVDFGWNYGSRSVLGNDLPTYPETTAIALLGLQGRNDIGASLDRAVKMSAEYGDRSPLARAWLRVAFRLHGVSVDLPLGAPLRDVVVTAVDALGAGPNCELLRAGELS
jgi:prenyltransferase/squalene oxidase-like repeat protein